MTLDLDFEQQRPVVVLDDGLTGLLDTGAYLPVWVDDEDILTDIMGAELVQRDVEFTGFGGVASGNLYRATFKVGKLIYPNMTIIANSELDVPFNMILSASMFQHLRYEVDDENHKFNVTIPDKESNVRNLVVETRDGKIFVLCNSAEG
ncbi:MAG: hypothetical protein K6F35_05010 [Lachnospiraceae bacterium]|nr:hypothetical protein [Lachnospiraceae bacterium]